ncbi:serine/arginine repetitive matrix protein 1-like [Cavia porcellus]|uniref:serine/arginine repetitive matrix protein 1-like n=1 Tax=Cavia porcellus TaxID=10141 RepID=UPI002FE235EE
MLTKTLSFLSTRGGPPPPSSSPPYPFSGLWAPLQGSVPKLNLEEPRGLSRDPPPTSFSQHLVLHAPGPRGASSPSSQLVPPPRRGLHPPRLPPPPGRPPPQGAPPAPSAPARDSLWPPFPAQKRQWRRRRRQRLRRPQQEQQRRIYRPPFPWRPPPSREEDSPGSWRTSLTWLRPKGVEEGPLIATDLLLLSPGGGGGRTLGTERKKGGLSKAEERQSHTLAAAAASERNAAYEGGGKNGEEKGGSEHEREGRKQGASGGKGAEPSSPGGQNPAGKPGHKLRGSWPSPPPPRRRGPPSLRSRPRRSTFAPGRGQTPLATPRPYSTPGSPSPRLSPRVRPSP